MTYGVKYQLGWSTGENAGFINIYQKDYTGEIDYSLRINALRISRLFEDWQEHILGTVCEFDIVNNKTNYFELFDLLIATEKKYKIVVEKYAPSPYVMFEGFVNTEANEQRYLHYSSIRIVASSYISKLENVYPIEMDTVEPLTFIDIIQACLADTNSVLPIYAYSWLISSNTPYNALQSFLNQNGVTTEIFWENNIDRVDSNQILESILESFQCYMYYWDGAWYIESFDRFFTETKTYIKYLAGQSYTPESEGTQFVSVFPVRDLHELQFIEMSQTVRTIPGNKTVQIRINTKPYYNLTINDFGDIVIITDENGFAPLREWRMFQPAAQTIMVWESMGLPYQKMVNSIKRTSTYTGVAPDYPYVYSNMLTTTMRLTVEENTVLQLDFKYAIAKVIFGIAQTDWANMRIRFRYKIVFRDITSGAVVGELLKDEDTDEVGYTTSYFATRHMTKRIGGSEFNKNTLTCEFSESYSIGEIDEDTEEPMVPFGSYLVSFVLFPEFIEYNLIALSKNQNFENERIPIPFVYYGDVRLSTSIEDWDKNVIEGKSNTDFLNKMEVEIDIADMPNWNYKNGVLEGTTLSTLTEYWYRNEAQQRKLVDYILIDKFRTGDITRQRITAKVKTADILRPFARFTESKQDGKQFLLTSIIHDVIRDEYEVTLDEYDNTTVITLVEE